ncbi:hypothetical protein ABMA27_011678 [Loxostege sticticalis]|uniref:THAP-type domain-containing protein n=1 Tax=Loxostege sticticalis TaxID=481309 RepID=A0ABR3IH14_LOXSC
MPYCAILSCKNSTRNVGRNNGNVSFHRFPNDPSIKEKWIDATGQKNWFPTKYSTICSIHFTEESFAETNKNRRLTTDAIPTIDVLKTSTYDDNNDLKLPANLSSPCSTATKRKLEKDPLLNTPKERKLLHRLNIAQKKIIKQNKKIKSLREQNRRRGLKIRTLVASLESLKKKSLISDEQ